MCEAILGLRHFYEKSPSRGLSPPTPRILGLSKKTKVN